MLSSEKTILVEAFLDQVSKMSVHDFQVVDQAALAVHAIRRGAFPLMKLAAADTSWLRKRVEDTVEPLIGNLDFGSDGLASASLFAVMGAARAIIRRDRLSEAQYEAYVGGFREAGLTIPAWGS